MPWDWTCSPRRIPIRQQLTGKRSCPRHRPLYRVDPRSHYFLPIYALFSYIEQVAKFVPVGQAKQIRETPEVLPGSEQAANEHVANELEPGEHSQLTNSDDFTSSDSVNDPDIVHVVGDIVHVCRTFLFPKCRYSISLSPVLSNPSRRHASESTGLYHFIRHRREFERNLRMLRSERDSIHFSLQNESRVVLPSRPCSPQY